MQAEFGNPPNVSFLMKCTLGDVSVQGEGKSKKLAKQNAAEEMWKILTKEVVISSVETSVDLSTNEVVTEKTSSEAESPE